ncbi:MAG TPA: MobF family relaxase [Acidimicrobiales bacterium]|nr:MobF family relaxase [Acidimicrobiales bacterium]
MAWMRMMGAESVDYHRETVLGRADDHPKAALEYYASRGETPLVWGGSGAPELGLHGPVSEAEYDAIFGPGGARRPSDGARLVATKRPGMELVVAAQKSVALLGLIGRAEDMHAILDAETDATLAYLDAWIKARGGRRGRSQTRGPTHGLIWARTRHATSRAGDPEPHDHILIANLCHMADVKGGWKALDTAALRDILHAATAFGRVASAAKAIELGYAIERDDGPSGRLGHWRIAGIPEGACELFSKRSAEITAAVESKGFSTYQARQTAARDTRKSKRHTPPSDLMAGWLAELAGAGYSPEALLRQVEKAATKRTLDRPAVLSTRQLSAVAAHVLGPSGRLAQQKVFTQADVAVAVGPLLFGFGLSELARVVRAVCAHPDAVALLGVKTAREQAYTPASVIANETAIALKAALQAGRTDAPAVDPETVEAAIAIKENELAGRPLTAGQKAMISAVATSGRGVELVVGVAGAGKTTAVDVTRRAFETAGYRVVGTSTSGQAARTLGAEAGIGESRTIASLMWRLDHGRIRLDRRTVVVCDEAGMTDDPNMLRLLAATETAGSKLIIIGDHRQLGSVGPGGSLQALVSRHSHGVHVLRENVRQADPQERSILAQLRAGNVEQAVNWYAEHGRIATTPNREHALDETVAAWAGDVAEGKNSTMVAWRRANVAALNHRARALMAEVGRLTGPELQAGGSTYQAGDRIVTLAPSAHGQLVTSQRGQVTAVDLDSGALHVRTDDGQVHTLGPDQVGRDQLAHSYATTVHRSQGATFDTAHLYADGGGRELAYVAMSRARQDSHVHAVADNIYQAVEDLTWDWSRERRQSWAIDTGTPDTSPGRTPLEIEADKRAPQKLRASLGRARLKAERDALADVRLGQSDPDLRRRVAQLDRQIHNLDHRLQPAREHPLDPFRASRVEPPAPPRPDLGPDISIPL